MHILALCQRPAGHAARDSPCRIGGVSWIPGKGIEGAYGIIGDCGDCAKRNGSDSRSGRVDLDVHVCGTGGFQSCGLPDEHGHQDIAVGHGEDWKPSSCNRNAGNPENHCAEGAARIAHV